jgi:AraC family transcriptional regulator, L-rhamnose operon regulatory protein RhaS
MTALRPLRTNSQQYVHLSSQRPVRFAVMPTPKPVFAHNHEYYELFFVVKGSGIHRTESGSAPLQRGDVVIIPVGATHAFDEPRGLTIINGYYLAEWLLRDSRLLAEEESVISHFLAAHLFRAPSFRQPFTLHLQTGEFERCLVDVDDLVQETLSENPSRLFLRSTLLKLFVRLQRNWKESDSPSAFAALRPEIRRVVDEIESRVLEGEPYDAQDVGQDAGLSLHHLGRVFKQETGWTPSEYYQRRRVQVACGLLLDPARVISDVVHELGFSDGPHFSRIFKSVTGRTPREYRKQFGSKISGSSAIKRSALRSSQGLR